MKRGLRGALLGSLILVLATGTALLGYGFARWQSGALDLLCAGDFEDYRTREELVDARGIRIPAGTLLRVRFCEYNAQARLEVLVDKDSIPLLEPAPEVSGSRWHYGVQAAP